MKNRFYVGDVVYKGEGHKGEHEPILDRELLDFDQDGFSALFRAVTALPDVMTHGPSRLASVGGKCRGRPDTPG